MKVLIIGCFDLRFHPYVEKYFEILRQNKIDYKFIFWNRSKIEIKSSEFIPFQCEINTYKFFLKKIICYLKYRKFVLNKIKKENPDKLIILATQTLILLGEKILKQYSNNFIFDYRDETYEKYQIYKNKVLEGIKLSKLTIFSSLGFLKRLNLSQSKKYVMCHNEKKWFKDINIEKNQSKKIRLSFWGMIRQPKYFCKIIDCFGNDDRFILSLYGEGNSDKIKKHIIKQRYDNVFVYGKYEQKDIIYFASNTDAIINAYSNKSIQNNALTVKMYEGFYFKIPMIIQSNSYMDIFLCENNYPHISLNFDSNLIINKDRLINDIIDMKEKLNTNSKQLLYKIKSEQKKFENKLINSLKGE